MSDITSADWGKLILRVSIGGMMLCHGIGTIVGGVDGVAGLFEGRGLPGFIAYGAYIGEVVAPIALIIGYYARPAAALLAFTMGTAILVAHPGDILALGDNGKWAIETPALFLFGGIAIAFLGAGRVALGKS